MSRVTGQLQAAARTGGVHDLIALGDLFRSVDWVEELKEFAEASEKAEAALKLLGTVDEISELKTATEIVLADAADSALGVTQEAIAKAKVIGGKTTKRKRVVEDREHVASKRELAVTEAETDIQARKDALAESEAVMELQAVQLAEATQAAVDEREKYQRLIAEIKAALPEGS